MTKKSVLLTALISAVSTILIFALVFFFTMPDAVRLLFLIRHTYAGEIAEESLDTGAVRGMMNTLTDPYSVYFTEEEYAMFLEEMDAAYTGIGVEIELKDEKMLVRQVFPDSPAAEAGILAGDILLSIDDLPVTPQTYSSAIEKMRTSNSDSPLSLSVQRGAKTLSFSVTRRTITLKTVETDSMGDVAYVRIKSFDSPTAGEVAAAIEKAERQNKTGLLIDVRDNPGGYLESVTTIADMLLPACTVVYTEDKNGNRDSQYESDADCTSLPIVLLINENSASASELLAGALKDNNRAQLVGQNTFGKGSVQTVFKLREGGVKMTVAHYFTAGGYKIDGAGISPHYTVENTGAEDLQLKKALSLFETPAIAP